MNAFELIDVSEALGDESLKEMLTSTSAELAIRRFNMQAPKSLRSRLLAALLLKAYGTHASRLHSAAATASAAFKDKQIQSSKFEQQSGSKFKSSPVSDTPLENIILSLPLMSQGSSVQRMLPLLPRATDLL